MQCFRCFLHSSLATSSITTLRIVIGVVNIKLEIDLLCYYTPGRQADRPQAPGKDGKREQKGGEREKREEKYASEYASEMKARRKNMGNDGV